MAAKVSRRLKQPLPLLIAAALLLFSVQHVLGATVAGAGAVVAGTEVKCQAASKGHSVLHGQQPTSKNVRYFDRTPTALKAGVIKEISVYYDSKQECIAGIKVTYGTKPGAVSHLMGTERGPGFYEKLLMLDQNEYINRVDVGYNSRCVQYVQWYTSDSRTLRAGASSSSSSSKTGVAVPENSDWHLAAIRGAFSDGVINQLQAVWGEVQCKKIETLDEPIPAVVRKSLPVAKQKKPAPAAQTQHSTAAEETEVTAPKSRAKMMASSSSSGAKTHHASSSSSSGAATTHYASSSKHPKAPARHSVPSVPAAEEEYTADAEEADTGSENTAADTSEVLDAVEADSGSGGGSITVKKMAIDVDGSDYWDPEEAEETATAADTDAADAADMSADVEYADAADAASADVVDAEISTDAADEGSADAWGDESTDAAVEEVQVPVPPPPQHQQQQHLQKAPGKSTASKKAPTTTTTATTSSSSSSVQQAKHKQVQAQPFKTPTPASSVKGSKTHQQPAQVQQALRSPAPAATPSRQPTKAHIMVTAPPPEAAAVVEDRAAAGGAAELDYIGDAIGLNADMPDLTALYTTDDVLAGVATEGASLAGDQQQGQPQQLQQQQQQLEQSIVARLVKHPAAASTAAAAAPSPAVGAVGDGLVPVTPVAALQANAVPLNQAASAAPAAVVPAVPAAGAVPGASPLDFLLQQQQQQPNLGDPAFAVPTSNIAVQQQAQLLDGDLLQQQRKQQLLQQHQQWQLQEFQKLQQQQQQQDAASILPPSAGSTPGSTTPKAMKFKAVVPPSVTCTAAPFMCDTQQIPGHPAACSAAAPLTQPECVGGCCMSSGKCSGLFGLGGTCATAGLGQSVPEMLCTGLNNGRDAEVLDGTFCQNLGCRLAIPGCLTSTGGVGGHCIGRVVALGPLTKSHPEGVRFLGYPCLDAAPSSKTLNLFGELTDKGYYVAQQWTVCNCNGAAMPQGAAVQGTADGTMSMLAAWQQPGAASLAESILAAAGGVGTQGKAAGSAPANGMSQALQLLSVLAASNSSAVNPAVAAAAAAEVLKHLSSTQAATTSNPRVNSAQGGLMASGSNPMGLEAAAGQLQGLQSTQGSVDAPAVLAGIQGLPNSAAAGSSGGSNAGFSWGDLIKETSAKAAAVMRGAEAAPANGTAAVLGNWMSALLTAAATGSTAGSKAGGTAQQQQVQANVQGPSSQAGQQQQQQQQQQEQEQQGSGWMGLLSKVLSAAKDPKAKAQSGSGTESDGAKSNAAVMQAEPSSANGYDFYDVQDTSDIETLPAVPSGTATGGIGYAGYLPTSSSSSGGGGGSGSSSGNIGYAATTAKLPRSGATPFLQAAQKSADSADFGYDDSDDYDSTAYSTGSTANAYSTAGTMYGGTYGGTDDDSYDDADGASMAYVATAGAVQPGSTKPRQHGRGQRKRPQAAGAGAIGAATATAASLGANEGASAPGGAHGGTDNAVSPQGVFEMPGGPVQQQRRPGGTRRAPVGTAGTGSTAPQQRQQQEPGGASNAFGSDGFVTNRPALYGGQKVGPAARAARARGMHGGGIAPMALGAAGSNMRQGQATSGNSTAAAAAAPGSDASDSQRSDSVTGAASVADVTSSGSSNGTENADRQQQQQQQTTQSAPSPRVPTAPRGTAQQQQQRHAQRHVRQAQQQQQHGTAAAHQAVHAAIAGTAQPANLPSQQQAAQTVQQQQQPQPVERTAVSQPLPPPQQQQPVSQPLPQQQQQEQPVVDVHVESVPQTSTSPHEPSVLAAASSGPVTATPAAPDSSSSSSSTAVGSDSTFVMPGGLPTRYNKVSMGIKPGTKSAAAAGASEHRGSGVVIDDDAWRQQTSGEEAGSEAQQGQRQMWQPS